MIRAQKSFTDPTTGKVTGVALLVQDAKGKVTDMSRALTPEQQSAAAFKQAEMFLTNIKKGEKEIVIRGGDPIMANKVFAALLVLKEKDPKLKDIKIKSFVAGCTGPQNTTFTPNSVTREKFIKDHLNWKEGQVTKDQAKELTKQVTEINKVLTVRSKQNFKDRLHNFIEKDTGKHRDHALKEGETLDLKGNVGKEEETLKDNVAKIAPRP